MNLDPKLVAAIVTAVITRLALELGISEDETLQTLVPLLAASVAGYLTSNDGTVLRTQHEDGNAHPPEPPEVSPKASRKAFQRKRAA